MLVNLADKVVLITGGARMGASLAHACAARGADVALSYSHSAHAITEVVTLGVRDGPARMPPSTRTCESRQHVVSLVDDVVAWAGRLDVLVCLASVYERVPLDALTPEDWREQLAVDLDASFHCARAAAAHMRARGAGHVDPVQRLGRGEWTPAVHGVPAVLRREGRCRGADRGPGARTRARRRSR